MKVTLHDLTNDAIFVLKGYQTENEKIVDLTRHFKNSGILPEKIKGLGLFRFDGSGQELHFEDWDRIIEEITKHKQG